MGCSGLACVPVDDRVAARVFRVGVRLTLDALYHGSIYSTSVVST